MKSVKDKKNKKDKKSSKGSTFNLNQTQKNREKSRMQKIEVSKQKEELELKKERVLIAEKLEQETKSKKHEEELNAVELQTNILIQPKEHQHTPAQQKKDINQIKSSLSIAKIGRRKLDVKKLAKELDAQEKDDSIPEPMKWNDVDVSNVIEKFNNQTVAKNYAKNTNNTKHNKHIVYELEKFENFQELSQASEDPSTSFKGQDFDFDKVGDPETIKKLTNMTFDSFATFEKKESTKKKTAKAKSKK